MVHCVSIKNIYTKKTLNCMYETNDVIKFMYDMFERQPINVLLLYTFDDNSQYITAYDKKEFMLEKINNKAELGMIEAFCDTNCNDEEKRIQRIIGGVFKFANQHNIKFSVNENDLRECLMKLKNEPDVKKVYDARDNYISEVSKPVNQEGGILIYLMEQKLFPKLSPKVRTVLESILEIIDAILIIGISIPGLQLVAGAGIIVDIVSFIYCFLRFDVLGMIASVIALIPVLGNIIGGGLRITAKSLKYYKKYKQYRKHARNIQHFTPLVQSYDQLDQSQQDQQQ